MLAFILKLLGVDPLGKIVDGLTRWREIEKNAENDDTRIRAQVEIKRLEAQLEQHKTAADVVKTGMQNKVFWIPWLIATVPTSLWYALGMIDSMANGSLPDVAALPPQLKEYADIAWANLFYAGGAVKGAEILGSYLKNRK